MPPAIGAFVVCSRQDHAFVSSYGVQMYVLDKVFHLRSEIAQDDEVRDFESANGGTSLHSEDVEFLCLLTLKICMLKAPPWIQVLRVCSQSRTEAHFYLCRRDLESLWPSLPHLGAAIPP
jgi:hypothetical protein